MDNLNQWFTNHPISTDIIKYVAWVRREVRRKRIEPTYGKVSLASATFETVKIPTVKWNEDKNKND